MIGRFPWGSVARYDQEELFQSSCVGGLSLGVGAGCLTGDYAPGRCCKDIGHLFSEGILGISSDSRTKPSFYVQPCAKITQIAPL
jgi:hypothetical protein